MPKIMDVDGNYVEFPAFDPVTGRLPAEVLPPLAGGDKHYRHRQTLASDVWLVEHGLGTWPSVTVCDTADSTVVGDVIYIDANRLEIHFSAPFSGVAYLN